MGYRRMKKRDLWELYRRWQDGQGISHIALGERRDRKTVRQYVGRFLELGLAPDAPVMDEQDFYRRVEGQLPAHADRPAPGSEQLAVHRDKIRDLINRGMEPLKPKTAFLVVSRKYALTVSYATFKRFARQQGLSKVERRAISSKQEWDRCLPSFRDAFRRPLAFLAIPTCVGNKCALYHSTMGSTMNMTI